MTPKANDPWARTQSSTGLWEATAEATVATLQEQMQASSLLLNALAEQNAELIRRVESHRVRILWLAGLVIVFGAIAALNLAVTFSR